MLECWRVITLINNPNHQWIDQNQKMMLIIIQSSSALCREGGGRREREMSARFCLCLAADSTVFSLQNGDLGNSATRGINGDQ